MDASHNDMIAGFDLESYVQRFGGVPIQSGEYALDCPVCGKPKKLIVNTDKKNWHCWVCEQYQATTQGRRRALAGAGGLLSFVEMMQKCDRDHAISYVVQHGRRVSLRVSATIKDMRAMPPTLQAGGIPWPDTCRPITATLTYIESRGITVDQARQFCLGYCTHGRYANRLIFPVWEDGVLVYYQGRAMWDGERGTGFIKALNPPAEHAQVRSHEVLFNLDQAKKYRRVVITEGPIDAVKVGPQAVATFGKRLSIRQIMKLQAAGVRAVDLMWDGQSTTEPNGTWADMMHAGGMLAGLFDVRLVRVPWGDPGEYSREENRDFIRRAIPFGAVSGISVL